jgi:anti-anti-sigma factor
MPGSLLSVEPTQRTGHVRLTLVGDLDRSSVPLLERWLARVEPERPRIIDLELSRLEFIDAGGMRAILHAARRAQEEGRQLTVSNPSSVVRRLFELTAIDHAVVMIIDGGGQRGASTTTGMSRSVRRS